MRIFNLVVSLFQTTVMIGLFLLCRSANRNWRLSLRREFRLMNISAAMAEYASNPCEGTRTAWHKAIYHWNYELQRQENLSFWQKVPAKLEEEWV